VTRHQLGSTALRLVGVLGCEAIADSELTISCNGPQCLRKYGGRSALILTYTEPVISLLAENARMAHPRS
jgi:hypothetical protein